MTFELRFDVAMVAGEPFDVPLANSPLLITPPLPGSFRWLSPRSGVFTPSEPLALDTRYELTLRSGLAQADGRPAKASLHRVISTPPFKVIASTPRMSNTNAVSDSQIKLLFNDEVRAADAQPFLWFRDNAGRRVAAEVCQGTVEELNYELQPSPADRAWYDSIRGSRSPNVPSDESEINPTNQVPNFLVVGPRQNLPLGDGWRLEIASSLPAQHHPRRLRKTERIPVGDVTPFQATDVTARNNILSGPAISFSFTKTVPDSLTNGIASWLNLSPCPTNIYVEVDGRTVTLTGAFEGGRKYSLDLRPDLQAVEPFRITGTTNFVVEVPHVASRLYFPAFSRDQLATGNRTFPLLSINVPRVYLRAKILDPQTAIHALRGYSSYFIQWNERMENDQRDNCYRPINYNVLPGRTVFNQTLDLNADSDVSKTLNLQWDQLLKGRKTGVVFLDAERQCESSDLMPLLGTQAIIQLTDLGMVWKQGGSGVDIFVFSQSTGQPVAGASAHLFSDENESLHDALTDTNGCAHLALDTNAEWIAVQYGDDFHALPLNQERVWLNHFDISSSGSLEHEDSQRVLLFSDRNLYRPGEPLYLCGIVREWNAQGLSILSNVMATIDCVDPQEHSFFRTNLNPGPSGRYAVTVPLPKNLHGDCMARLHLGTNDYVYPFSIQDFQADAFQVFVQCTNSFAPSNKVAATVSAKYFFGKAVSRAKVKWSLQASDFPFQPARFPAYQFSRSDYESGRRFSRSSVTLNGDAVLSDATNLVITPDIPINPTAPQPRRADLHVEVTDVNQQTISEDTQFTRHSSDFYLGLRQAASIITNSDSLPLEILAVGADGKPWAKTVKAHLALQGVNWQTVRLQGAGKSVRYHNEAILTNILEREIEIPPIELPAGKDAEVFGNKITDLPSLPAGEYLIEATTTDEAGHSIASSLTFQVSASGTLARNYRDDTQLNLKPDQTDYQIGKTAEILVEAPFSGTALVTVEREKLLRAFTMRLEGNAPSIHVPILPGDAPNVFVSVALIRGADECPHKMKEPEYRIGFCELHVADPQSKLAVTVTPAKASCEPGEMVDVTVNVADAKGAPVPNADVVLYAVDEGILSLNDPGLPDPYSFFYESRSLSVQSSVSLPNLLTEDPTDLSFENKGFLVGDGKECAKNRASLDHLRKKFLPCAFWKSDLTTDSEGHATVHFSAPDNLTRYRLCAIASAGSSSFGSARAEFQISKPLVIEPALPAFANITDKLIARGVIQNLTTNAADVVVTLQLDDKVKDANAGQPLSRKVSIPANSSTAVEFPLQLADLGTATWIWKVSFADPALGDFSDSVQSTIEVGHIAPSLREVLLDHITGFSTNLLAHADPQLLAGIGAITVNIANTRLNDLGEAILQLLHYPYGCAEQTGSSLLPWIVLHDNPNLLPPLRRGTNEVNAAISAGVERFFSMQTKSGGLGYWPHSSEPMLWASAYGGMVLALARQHGVEMPSEEFESLLKYLRAQLRSSTSDPSALSDQCLAVYALALSDQSEPAYHEKLYSERDKLSTEDRALLALAIAQTHGPEDMIAELLKPAKTAQSFDDSRFGCDARGEAIQLLAWTHHQPGSPLLDHYVDDLMRDQKQAHWGTTQGDAWALLALTEYARLVEDKLQPAEGTLQWNGQPVPFHLDNQTKLFSQTFPLTNYANAVAALNSVSTNRLYTSVTIESRSRETEIPRQDRGFAIRRHYEKLNDDNLPEEAKNLHVGDRVLVTLNISVREPARYIAVDDALPSILEAINPEFKTRQTQSPTHPDEGTSWFSDFREIRKDRCLYFVNWLSPGNYSLRYVARVRAAGTVTAPSAKIEEMYHPERCGLSGTQIVSSQALE